VHVIEGGIELRIVTPKGFYGCTEFKGTELIVRNHDEAVIE
jgi:hypothetical protein